jgi:hypothetical protein
MTRALSDIAPRGPSRRRVLAGGLAVACLPAVAGASSFAADRLPAGVTPLAVAPGLPAGSVHLMRREGRLILVTAPGAGLAYPLHVGARAAGHPADSFLALAPGAAGIALHDRLRGAASFAIAAVDGTGGGEGFGLRPDHLDDLRARLHPGAPGVLYA